MHVSYNEYILVRFYLLTRVTKLSEDIVNMFVLKLWQNKKGFPASNNIRLYDTYLYTYCTLILGTRQLAQLQLGLAGWTPTIMVLKIALQSMVVDQKMIGNVQIVTHSFVNLLNDSIVEVICSKNSSQKQ